MNAARSGLLSSKVAERLEEALSWKANEVSAEETIDKIYDMLMMDHKVTPPGVSQVRVHTVTAPPNYWNVSFQGINLHAAQLLDYLSQWRE